MLGPYTCLRLACVVVVSLRVRGARHSFSRAKLSRAKLLRDSALAERERLPRRLFLFEISIY